MTPKPETTSLAEKIAKALFTDAFDTGTRLQIMKGDGNKETPLGGWCLSAAIKQIEKVLLGEELHTRNAVLQELGICQECLEPFVHDFNEPFAHCDCGTSEWTFSDPEKLPLLMRRQYHQYQKAMKRLCPLCKAISPIEAPKCHNCGCMFHSAEEGPRPAILDPEHYPEDRKQPPTLREVYESMLGGVLAISPEHYGSVVEKMAAMMGRVNDEAFRAEVAEVGRSFPSDLD
jgi:hypothetical protein